MNPRFRPPRPAVLALLASLALTGCISNTVAPDQMAADWQAEILRSRPSPIDVSGTYLERGEGPSMDFSKTGRLMTTSLASVLFEGVRPRPPNSHEIQLVQHGVGRLECHLRRDGATIWSHEFAITVDAANGLVVLPPAERTVDGPGPTSGAARSRVRLFKGADGRLYAHVDFSASGVFALIPVSVAFDRWSRWAPSSPAALATIAEDEARRRAAQAGQPCPEFSAMDLAGQPVSPAQLRGQVAVLHFWSQPARGRASVGDVGQLARIRASYGAASLNVISICLDGTREQLEALAREHRMDWRHVHDAGGWDGPLARQFALAGRPLFFLLDRSGQIVARDMAVGRIALELRRACVLPAPAPP